MRKPKAKSLSALASSLDTRKRALPGDARPGQVSLRSPSSSASSAAPTALSRRPSPVPTHVPAEPNREDPRRRYPRAELNVRTRLSLIDHPSRVFQATLPTLNLSVGGLFLQSSFFLKLGTKLLVELELPGTGPKAKVRHVRVKGEVVRVETGGEGRSGFALRFTEYLDGSEVVLATHFLSPVLREFIQAYAKEHRFEASPEYIAHTADVLAAWELRKAELGSDVWQLAGHR